ncbi:radical SAM/SPASM domain-containing protein [Porphyromonas gingivalis]|uniref:Radical SAM domain protein n=1 Tax=Porphyromonas gingivalis F0570 TaxID=1227271 RepID=A0A0E2LTX2_PORGN|nr:radical SAM protein [Porphyromonas gingivalis]ERJ68894.1 radical SAM domain protein [Porphyromonas gingivalis F0570]
MKLVNDLYLLPIERGNIVYSPLRQAAFWASDEASQYVRRYLEGQPLPEECDLPEISYLKELEQAPFREPHNPAIPNQGRLVVIPSQLCNLACSYCYARKAHARDTIDLVTLRIAIDKMLRYDKSNHKHISLIGGGEPFMTWDIIMWIVEYAEANKRAKDKLSFAITTNATLLNRTRIEYCKAHNIRVNASFEVLPEVQEGQRPFYNSPMSTYEIVDRNIRRLLEHGVICTIRSTITSRNVERMSEMVQLVVDRYPGIQGLHVEQVTDGREDYIDFYDKFVKHFDNAIQLAQKYNLRLSNSINNSLKQLKNRFCSGENCITPGGDLTACHRISTARDKGFDLFRYGSISDGKAEINQKQWLAYLDFSEKKLPECKTCFAYWHCAGICPMERVELTSAHIRAKCIFIRSMLTQALKRELFV